MCFFCFVWQSFSHHLKKFGKRNEYNRLKTSDKDLLAVLDINTCFGRFVDTAALEVIDGRISCRPGIVTQAVDTCGQIAVGGEAELADDAVAPLSGGRIDGDDVVALLGDVELKGLLLDS